MPILPYDMFTVGTTGTATHPARHVQGFAAGRRFRLRGTSCNCLALSMFIFGLQALSRATPGYVGADLKSLVNEAGLISVRAIENAHFYCVIILQVSRVFHLAANASQQEQGISLQILVSRVAIMSLYFS